MQTMPKKEKESGLIKAVVRPGKTYGARELFRKAGEILEVSEDELRQASPFLISVAEMEKEKAAEKSKEVKKQVDYEELRSSFVERSRQGINAALVAQQKKQEYLTKQTEQMQKLVDAQKDPSKE